MIHQFLIYCSVTLILLISNSAWAGDDVWVEMSLAKPGQLVRTIWNGKPIGVLFRSNEMIKALNSKYELTDVGNQNGIIGIYRSLKPTHFVFIDQSTKSDCRLRYVGNGKEAGLIDACENIRFDFSGRSDGNLALEIPPHKMVTETKIIFGSFE
jgi:ubiquinol-cytochrome c reductase iron-sulfur subunit